nr:hypothetical protein [Tanacetum cinerariifolium]
MATLIVSISSDSSEESVGSSTSRVVMLGTIPTVIPADVSIVGPTVPEVTMNIFASPTWASDDSPGSDSCEILSSLDSYEVLVTCLRGKVASRSVSSPSSSSSSSSSSTHALPSTNIASPAPHRIVHEPPGHTDLAAPLSTMYPLTTFESSSRDFSYDASTSSSERPLHLPATHSPTPSPSAGPSRKRFCGTSSIANAKTGEDLEKTNSGAGTKILNVGEEQGDDVSNTVALEKKKAELDEGQARSDPGKTPESQPLPEHEHMEED